MKCPDCEMNTDRLVASTGTCLPCYKRYQNMKYRKIDYIPLKDIKGTTEYNKVMGKRNATIARHKGDKDYKINDKTKKTKKAVISTRTTDIKYDIVENQYDIVMDDIKKIFSDKGIQWPNDTTSILPVFNQLSVLLDNYISIYLQAEDLLNKTELDYRHAKEYYASIYKKMCMANDYSKIEEVKKKKDIWEERHTSLLEIRRGIKNVIAEYNAAGVLFTELSNDKQWMKKFNSYYDSLKKINSIVSQGNYRAEVSHLVSDEDFCFGFKTETSPEGNKKFNVSTRTLYRGNQSSFSRNIWAKDEKDAVAKFKKYIKDNNINIFFKEEDIVVVPATKECL